MTELFRFLIGTCSLYYCSFAVIHVEGFASLAVRVYDKQAQVIEVEYYNLQQLGFDVAKLIWKEES